MLQELCKLVSGTAAARLLHIQVIATYMVRGVGGGVALIGCVRSGDGRVLQWLILALPASHFGHYSMFARSIHNVLIPIDSA